MYRLFASYSKSSPQGKTGLPVPAAGKTKGNGGLVLFLCFALQLCEFSQEANILLSVGHPAGLK